MGFVCFNLCFEVLVLGFRGLGGFVLVWVWLVEFRVGMVDCVWLGTVFRVLICWLV